MGDKRTDPGQYYPGGKVVSQHGVAPPQIIVQWSDVQGKPQIAPLPDRYSDGDMKEKVNEIASKFATVVVAALIGWTACADITVQKKRKDQIYNDELVVVDVSGEGGGVDTNAVRDIAREEIVPATNRLNQALSDAFDDKRDKDDLAVYEVVRTENTDWTLTTNVVDRLATTNGVNAAVSSKMDKVITPSRGFLIADENGNAKPSMMVDEITIGEIKNSLNTKADKATTLSGYGITDGATKDELADRYTIKSETFTNDVSAVVTNDVERWDISGTPKAQSYYWIYFDPDHPYAFLMDGNETVSERPYTQGVKTLHFTLSYSLDPIDITARLITENALGLAYSKNIPTISATDPTFSNAVMAVTTNTIRREVSSALNTYVDCETGVEYVGKFYGGSLYYVPTGNVYPANN